jgi:DNA-binding CsgD family transcriptional regulator
LGDISSDSSGAARVVAKRRLIRDKGKSFGVQRSKDFGLLPREEQIIALTVDGYSTQETAERIGISEPALRLQLASVYQKLRVSNQFELMLFAVYHQLTDTSDPTLSCFRKRPRLKNNVWSKSPL